MSEEVSPHFHWSSTWPEKWILKRITSQLGSLKESKELEAGSKRKSLQRTHNIIHSVPMLEPTTLISKMRKSRNVYNLIFPKIFFKTSKHLRENSWFSKIQSLKIHNNKKPGTFIKADSFIWLMIGKNKYNPKKAWTFLL